MIRILKLALCLLFMSSGLSWAHGYTVGAVEIEHPWARATAGHAANGAVYFVLKCSSPEGDRLLSASTPVAKKAELHMHAVDNGVMKMRPLDAIEITQGSPTPLQPGGLHIMLIGLKKPLIKGKAFPMTLTFENAGPIAVMVEVQGVGDLMPSHQ